MIFGYFDYLILAILIFLNIKFWRSKFEIGIGCILGGLIFGMVLPIISIIIELAIVESSGGWMDSFEVAYVYIKFPIYWTIGLTQAILTGIKLNCLKTQSKQNQIDSDLVKEAILDYRNEGKRLMFELGKKYGLDIENPNEYNELISKGNKDIPRKGEISKRWSYSFHGSECGFFNRKSQQRIEVVLSNPSEFGRIDSWFLLSFMESNHKYKDAVKGMDWQDLKPVVESLSQKGEIVKVDRY